MMLFCGIVMHFISKARKTICNKLSSTIDSKGYGTSCPRVTRALQHRSAARQRTPEREVVEIWNGICSTRGSCPDKHSLSARQTCITGTN